MIDPLDGRVRRFGTARGDVEVDLDGPLDPLAVTRVLAATIGDAPDEAWLWDLDVGTRIAGVLLAAYDRSSSLTVTLRCGACDEPIEIELGVAELCERERQMAARTITIPASGGTLRLRRPTGRDQLRWLAQSYPDEAAARAEIVRTLVVEPASGDPLLDETDEMLAEHDPLVNPVVAARCFACEAETAVALDLLTTIREQLRDLQDELILTVHALASAYGWTEDTVLAIPPARRLRYRELIDRDVMRR